MNNNVLHQKKKTNNTLKSVDISNSMFKAIRDYQSDDVSIHFAGKNFKWYIGKTYVIKNEDGETLKVENTCQNPWIIKRIKP